MWKWRANRACALKRCYRDVLVAPLAIAFCIAAAEAGNLAQADEAADARQVLEAAALTNSGGLWICPEEIEFRRWLDAADPIERQYQAVQQALDDHIRRNDAAGRELASKRREMKAIEKKRAATAGTVIGPTKEQLDRSYSDLQKRVAQLRKEFRKPDRFAEYQPVRDEAIRLANARASVTLAAIALRGKLVAMTARYERLGAQHEIVTALAAQTPPHRLGPAKEYSAEAAKRLARLDKIASSASMPIFREDNHLRFVAVVCDSMPITFSLRESDGPTHLPSSMAQSLGIAVDNLPKAEYAFGGRKLVCQKIVLPSVRIANREFKNVAALLLPPEGDDLGAKLGRDAYAGYHLEADLASLRATVVEGELSAGSSSGVVTKTPPVAPTTVPNEAERPKKGGVPLRRK
jgi:hypothetical protein